MNANRDAGLAAEQSGGSCAAEPTGAHTKIADSSKYGKVKITKTSKHFLIGNATSHTWPFSAIAELIDNAVDAQSKKCDVDVDMESFLDDDYSPMPALVVSDNGSGMEADTLLNALGFGFSNKPKPGDVSAKEYIGWAGNGLKSASMRLASDLVVFTKTKFSQSVGILSQTFLKHSGDEHIRVPLLTWDLNGKCLIDDTDEVRQNLAAVKECSDLFCTERQILDQLGTIEDTGTILILINLKKQSDGTHELLWYKENVPGQGVCVVDMQLRRQPPDKGSKVGGARGCAALEWSLQKYLEVLYKESSLRITSCGITVRARRMASYIEDRVIYDYHQQQTDGSASVAKAKIYVGFWPLNQEGPDSTFTALLYYHNRLISPFKRVPTIKGRTEDTSDPKGRVAVAVVDADWLTPAHNKQEFHDDNGAYRKLQEAIRGRLNEFWDLKVMAAKQGADHFRKQRPSSGVDVGTWVQCTICLKWRRMPADVPFNDPRFEGDWECEYSPVEAMAKLGCKAQQEPDVDEVAERLEHKRLRFKVAAAAKKRSHEADGETLAQAAKRKRMEKDTRGAIAAAAAAAAAAAVRKEARRGEAVEKEKLRLRKLEGEAVEKAEKQAARAAAESARRSRIRADKAAREAAKATAKATAEEERLKRKRNAEEAAAAETAQARKAAALREQQIDERQQRRVALHEARDAQAMANAITAAGLEQEDVVSPCMLTADTQLSPSEPADDLALSAAASQAAGAVATASPPHDDPLSPTLEHQNPPLPTQGDGSSSRDESWVVAKAVHDALGAFRAEMTDLIAEGRLEDLQHRFDNASFQIMDAVLEGPPLQSDQ